MPEAPALSALRAQLDVAFDDPQLDAFCLDHFPKVFDQFGRGLRRDAKVNTVAVLRLLNCSVKHDAYPLIVLGGRE